MKKKVILFCAFLPGLMAHGQNTPDFQVYKKDGLYQFDDTRKVLKSEVFTTYLSSFGFSQNNSMVFQKEQKMDDYGGLAGTYLQYCNGYPVQGATMNVISKYGVVLYVNGFSLPTLNINVSSPVSESTALASAISYINAPKYNWEDSALENDIKYRTDTNTQDSSVYYDSTATLYPKGQLVITQPWGDTDYNDTARYALCWKFNISPMYLDTVITDTSTVDTVKKYDTLIAYRPATSRIIYVNAKTGQIFGVDPNLYGNYFVSCSVNPTWYEGNQNIEGRTCTFCWYTRLIDSRKMELWDWGNMVSGALKNHSGAWGKGTGSSVYWEMEKAFDYFRDIHGINALGGKEAEIIFNYDHDVIYHRMAFNPHSTGVEGYNVFQINKDVAAGGALAESAAQLDVSSHEIMHALIYNKPAGSGFSNTGEAAAIGEGFCDYFGIYAATWIYPDRYLSDWTNGFGWQTGEYSRKIYDPASDSPIPAADYYHGAHYTSDVYARSGVMRKVLGLCEAGGTHNGIHVDAIPGPMTDAFVTMYLWTWNNMTFLDLKSQFLAEYKLFYGICSPKWNSMARAWASVGVGTIPNCSKTWLETIMHVIPVTPREFGLGDNKNTTGVKYGVRPNIGPLPDIKVHLTEGNGQLQIQSYTWVIPNGVYISYPFQNDRSWIRIDSVNNLDSRYLSCIVKYADTAFPPDTLTTVIHFVDDYETIENKHSNNGGVFSNNNAQTQDDMQVFPNPVKGQLNITLPFPPNEPMEFHIFTMAGKEIPMSDKYLHNKNNLVLLPELPQGIYIIKANGNGKGYVRRITVQ